MDQQTLETGTDDVFELDPIDSMYALEATLRRFPDLHVRYSEGPTTDLSEAARDAESGLELPGLPVEPLQPEQWWHRPVSDWLARQLRRYRRLVAQHPERFAWVLTGRLNGRGPDCEPLIGDPVAVARLSPGLLAEAEERYRRHFESEPDSAG